MAKESLDINSEIAHAKDLESRGQLTDAALSYQRIFARYPLDKTVVKRLLIIYRKLKEYRKEQLVLKDAIEAAKKREIGLRDEWLKAHPKAANVGISILRRLERGGNGISATSADPAVSNWIKRKEFVDSKISGKKRSPHPTAKAPVKATIRKPGLKKSIGKKPTQQIGKKSAQRIGKKSSQSNGKKPTQRIGKKKHFTLSPGKKDPGKGKKLSLSNKISKPSPAVVNMHPSLFIVSLKYRVPLGQIDAMMPKHIAYLDKYYEQGDFLVSGRQVPRKGGIIIVRGVNKSAVEKIVKQDPFIKNGLATVGIVEFSPSRSSGQWKELK